MTPRVLVLPAPTPCAVAFHRAPAPWVGRDVLALLDEWIPGGGR